jgi:serine protease Do
MNEKKSINILFILIIVLIITNGVSIYFFYSKSINLSNQVDNLKINTETSNKDIQNKINSLSTSINTLSASVNSISSTQTSLSSQLSQIKAATSADFSGIIEQEIKGVVTIKTDVAQGTGFLITNDGYIVTNAHVLSGARIANAYDYNNNEYHASLIGYDNNMDVAVLKISGSFTKLTLGNSDETKIGEKVIAIGNPLGLSFTATEGIISARDREGINNLPYYFQTDVALNPGNSGGPLINTNAQVIGINNFKTSGAENIGFALESNYLKQEINQITIKNLNQSII